MQKKHIIIWLFGFALFLTFCSDEEPTTPPIEKEKSLIILSPIGGEIYFVNDTLKIEWESQNIDSIDAFISYDKMTNWLRIDSSIDASIGYCLTTIPDSVSEECFVKIIATEDSTLSNISNSAFSIIKKYISILSPVGGETYLVNDTLEIKWESQNVDFVSIYLSTDNGANWEQLEEKIEPTINKYSFILDEIVSEQCLVKISDYDDLTIIDISDSPFSIIKPIDNFFPLAIGNTWIYHVEKKSYPNWQPKIYNERVSIVGTKELDEKNYFDFLIKTTDGDETHEYYYMDESTKMVYIYNDYTETGQQFADLSFPEGTHEWISGASVIVTENEENILGQFRKIKQYDYYAPFSRWKHNFTESIGITYKWSSDESYLIEKEILGAIIDDIALGDTTFTKP